MKRLVVCSLAVVTLAVLLAAQSPAARIDGDQLRISAPRLHLLAGDALTRLRDGATVKYELQLTARTDRNGRVLSRTQEQFALSYDLWEEKFAIKKLGPSPRSISHLSPAAAEAWCVDNISVPVSALSGSQSFWIRIDFKAEEAGTSNDPPDNSGFTLSGLIDIFSRRTRAEQLRGSDEIGPLRLDALKKK